MVAELMFGLASKSANHFSGGNPAALTRRMLRRGRVVHPANRRSARSLGGQLHAFRDGNHVLVTSPHRRPVPAMPVRPARGWMGSLAEHCGGFSELLHSIGLQPEPSRRRGG